MSNRKKMNEMWDDVFDEFALYFPAFAEQTVDWYPSGRSEITVKLEDGSVKYYNHLYKTIRYAKCTDDNKIDVEQDLRRIIARRLNDIMYRQGIAQYELSKLTGISTVTLSKYANAKATPSVYNIQKIADALNCSIYELIE